MHGICRMSERYKKFAEELDKLINDGHLLLRSIQYDCEPQQFKKAYLKRYKGDEDKVQSLLKDLPNFKNNYQAWYSKSQTLIKQVMPGRLADFMSYFGSPKERKEITFQNYMIRDYLQGLEVTRGPEKHVIASGRAAIPEFQQQLYIVMAAKSMLNSTLMDLTSILQADLFDTEVEESEALAKAGHLRAAGVICGVVIEKHLYHVCEIHNISVRKRNPNISDFNQTLRDASVIEVPQWRYIQHLADIRNICGHKKEREPTKEEIDDLIVGTKKVLKTVF